MRRLALLAALTALLAPASASAQVAAPYTTPPPPEHRAGPGLTTYVFRVGPFEIGGYRTVRRNDLVAPPPVAGAIVGMDVRMINADGTEIPRAS